MDPLVGHAGHGLLAAAVGVDGHTELGLGEQFDRREARGMKFIMMASAPAPMARLASSTMRSGRVVTCGA